MKDYIIIRVLFWAAVAVASYSPLELSRYILIYPYWDTFPLRMRILELSLIWLGTFGLAFVCTVLLRFKDIDRNRS